MKNKNYTNIKSKDVQRKLKEKTNMTKAFITRENTSSKIKALLTVKNSTSRFFIKVLGTLFNRFSILNTLITLVLLNKVFSETKQNIKFFNQKMRIERIIFLKKNKQLEHVEI